MRILSRLDAACRSQDQRPHRPRRLPELPYSRICARRRCHQDIVGLVDRRPQGCRRQARLHQGRARPPCLFGREGRLRLRRERPSDLSLVQRRDRTDGDHRQARRQGQGRRPDAQPHRGQPDGRQVSHLAVQGDEGQAALRSGAQHAGRQPCLMARTTAPSGPISTIPRRSLSA